MSTQVYKFLIPLSCGTELQVALFKDWSNLLESKNYFFTYLLFCLFLAEKNMFLHNIFTFGYRDKKISHAHFSISTALVITFWYIFKLLKTVIYTAVYILQYSYISNYSFFIFCFYGHWGLKPIVSLRLVYYRFSADC